MGSSAPQRSKTKRRAQAQQNPAEKPAGSAQSILLSWLISIVWHAAIFTAMFATAWLADVASQDDDIPIAETDLLGDVAQTRLEVSAQGPVSLNQPPQQPDQPELEPKQFDALSESASAARPELSIVGIGTGGGSDLSKYGLEASGGPGPNFFGLGTKARGARRIVYVVDRSGSMMTTFDAVRQEMRRSIDGLRRTQKLHVICFNAGTPLENKPKKLVPALGRFKDQVFEFLDSVQPEGSTDPIPAMERAFQVRPDLIYFLTDGDFDPALLERLETLNPGRKVRIFTIAYVSESGRPLLEAIAREHNGEFRYVSEHDIY